MRPEKNTQEFHPDIQKTDKSKENQTHTHIQRYKDRHTDPVNLTAPAIPAIHHITRIPTGHERWIEKIMMGDK